MFLGKSRKITCLLALVVGLPACSENKASNTNDSGTDAVVPDAAPHPGLTDPTQANETAPAEFNVLFETTQGNFTAKVVRSKAPNGADRLYNLVRIGYYNDMAFFRVVDGFVAQFGISGLPAANNAWSDQTFADDPQMGSNLRGALTFATGGLNDRTTQLFVNIGNNTHLDNYPGSSFPVVGTIDEAGMLVVDKLYNGYGDFAPEGNAPDHSKLHSMGNAYLRTSYPLLDYITRATIR